MPWARGGFVGVDVFFVVSGFLITGLLLRDAERLAPRRQLLDFYARRARRILPAAATVIVGTLAMAVVLETPFDQARATAGARAAALFYANVHQAGIGGYFGTIGHELFQQYWSLSVEEQFYALWPLVFVGVSALVALRYRRRVLFAVIAVASVASFALNLAWVYDDGWLTTEPTRAFFWLHARLWELGLGALLACAAPRIVRLGATARQALFVGGLATITVSMLVITRTTPFPGWAALAPTLGTVAVLASGTGASVRGPLPRVLTNRGAQLLGRYSYSLYLWHWPVVLLIGPKVDGPWPWRFAVVAALSLVAAVITFHVVEDPARHASAFRARPSLALGLGAVAIAACVLAAVLVDARAVDALTGRAVPAGLTPDLTRARTSHAGQSCHVHCVTRRDGHGSVAFFGDSHLEHLGPGLEAAADRLRASSEQDWKYGCPWFAVIPWLKSIEKCSTYRDEKFAEYRAHPPDVIVLSSRDDAVRNADAVAWEAGIRRSLARLPRRSHVVVLGDTPASKQFIPRCLAQHLDDTRPCEPVWPDALNAQLRAIVESEGATFVDLRPVFCGGGRCPVIVGKTLVWGDDDHITAAFAVKLAPFLAGALAPLLPARR